MVKNLSPGYYVTQDMKSFSPIDLAEMIGGGRAAPSVRTLARTVEWVFVALNTRRDRMEQVAAEIDWMVGDKVQDSPWLGLDPSTISRIDRALRLHSTAYFHKRRTNRNRVDKLAWLDPVSIWPKNPHLASLYDGHSLYTLNTTGTPEDVPVEDLIRFEILDVGAWEISPSAAQATSIAAQVLRGISKTADSIFDRNNGLPTLLVKVPDGTDKEEIEELEDYFSRFFNRLRGAGSDQKTVAVEESVEIEPLSLAPKDLAFDDVGKDKIRAILAAFQVRESEVFGNAANYATAERDTREFTRSLIATAKYIANVFNEDPDLKRMRHSIRVDASDMLANTQDLMDRTTVLNSVYDRLIQTGEEVGKIFLIAADVAGVHIKEETRDEIEALRPPTIQVQEETGEGVKSENPILGYHIESGVVTRDEVRQRLGLPASGSGEEERRELVSKLELMTVARAAGLDVDRAAVLAKLDLPSPMTDPASPSEEEIEEITKAIDEIEKAEESRLRRYLKRNGVDGRPFVSDVLSLTRIQEIYAEFAGEDELWTIYP